MNDEQIIELYFNRDEQAINETSNNYGSYCCKIAYNILGNLQDAEECVSDALVKVWNSIPPQNPENLSAYLGKIVRNIALDKYRRNSAEKRADTGMALAIDEISEILPSKDSVEKAVDVKELVAVINAFLKELKPDARKIFVQKYWYFSSVKEIAQMFSLTESKVTVTLTRTRKKLYDHLKKEDIL